MANLHNTGGDYTGIETTVAGIMFLANATIATVAKVFADMATGCGIVCDLYANSVAQMELGIGAEIFPGETDDGDVFACAAGGDGVTFVL